MRPRPRMLAGPLLAGALVLAACGGGDDNDGASSDTSGGGGDSNLPDCPVDALDSASGPVNVTLWHGMGGAEIEQAIIDVTAAYNEGQDRVHVDLVNQQGYEENFDAFRTATSQDRPNLIQLPEYDLQAMADSGTIIPAQSCAEADGFDLDPLVDRAVEYYTLEDVLQTMPFNVSNPVLYYNKSMFEAAGLDPNRPPTTLDELRQYCQQIVDSGAATYGIALETGFDSGGGWFIEQFFGRAGELYADHENGRDGRATEVLFDNQFGQDMFGFLQQLVADGLAFNVGENAAGTDQLFKMADQTEPAAMAIYSSAGISSVMSALSGGLVPGFTPETLGIGPMPSPEGSGGVVVGGAAMWIVADKTDEEIAATWDFIKYLVSAQTQSTWADATGYVPVNEDAVTMAPLSDRYANDPRFKVPYDQLNAGEVNAATAGPVLGPLRQIRGLTAAALQSVLSGGVDPAQALGDAATQANALIEDYATRTGTGD